MANVQDFSVVRNGTININNFPRYTISARVEEVNPDTGLYENIADFRGANALSFPAVLTTLTPEQRDDFIQMTALWIVRVRAGLAP